MYTYLLTYLLTYILTYSIRQYVCKEVSVFLEFEHHLGDLAVAYTGAIVTPNKQKAVSVSTTPLSPSSPIRSLTLSLTNLFT